MAHESVQRTLTNVTSSSLQLSSSSWSVEEIGRDSRIRNWWSLNEQFAQGEVKSSFESWVYEFLSDDRNIYTLWKRWNREETISLRQTGEVRLPCTFRPWFEIEEEDVGESTHRKEEEEVKNRAIRIRLIYRSISKWRSEGATHSCRRRTLGESTYPRQRKKVIVRSQLHTLWEGNLLKINNPL